LIQFRRGTALQWSLANPTLAAGEFGYETDTRKFKLGAGAWNSLPYIDAPTVLAASAGAVIDANLAARQITFSDLGDGQGFFAVGGVQVSGTLVPPAAVWSGIAGKPERAVTEFGALGNGSHDDTDAFHAARDAAGAGGTIVVPPGTYCVDPLAFNTAGQTWRILGTVKFAGDPADSCITITGADVTVTGGVIDLSAMSGIPDEWQGHAISVQADGATIHDVNIRDSHTHGVYAINVNRLTVTGCTITNSYVCGIMAQVTESDAQVFDYVITGNTILAETPTGAVEQCGIYLRTESDGQAYNRVRVSNNTVVVPFGTDSTHAGITLWRVNAGVVDSNVVVGGWATITCPWLDGVTFSNNTLRGFYCVGIELPQKQHCVTVSGNTIDADGHGVGNYQGIWSSVNTGDPLFSNVTITGNSITGFTSDASGTGRGICFANGQSLDGVTISGNTIVAGDGGGVGFEAITVNCDSTNLTIVGNTIDGSSQTNSWGVFPYGTHDHVGMVVVGNSFSNLTEAPFEAAVWSTGSYSHLVYASNLARNCRVSIVETDDWAAITDSALSTAIAPATGSGDAHTQLNVLLAALRSIGLIR
jgi:hypothetical protein